MGIMVDLYVGKAKGEHTWVEEAGEKNTELEIGKGPGEGG